MYVKIADIKSKKLKIYNDIRGLLNVIDYLYFYYYYFLILKNTTASV